MTTSSFFDKTTATHKKPARTGGDLNRSTGKFTSPAQTSKSIKIHVSKPKGDEVLNGGLHVESEDLIVHADANLGIEATDTLAFWDSEYRVVAELNRYDVAKAVVNHDRRRYLVRRSGTYTNAP